MAATQPILETRDDPDLSVIGSPEMYVGARRNAGAIVRLQTIRVGEQRYAAPAFVPLNHFALSGTWRLSEEHATLSADGGKIVLRFQAPKVNVVAGSQWCKDNGAGDCACSSPAPLSKASYYFRR